MKRITAFILCLFLIGAPAAYAETTSCEDDVYATAGEFYDMLSPYCNDATAYGIIGMYYRESQFQSNAYGGWHWALEKCIKGETIPEMRHRLVDAWTDSIDKDTEHGRERFISITCNKTGGYGLCQWLGEEYLGDLYDFAKQNESSLGDAEMQVKYTIWSMQEHRPELWKTLQETTDVHTAGMLIAKFYEGTTVPESTASFAVHFYHYFKDGHK